MVDIDVKTTLGAEDRAGLARLLRDAVEGGASVGYVLPVSAADIDAYWQGVAVAMSDGATKLLVARLDHNIVGAVQLALANKPNARHRAEVQKLLVHSAAQRRGIGRQLMLAAEHVARAEKRELLVLDTESHSGAQYLYASLGYAIAGEIPRYAIGTVDGWTPSTFMYKILSPA